MANHKTVSMGLLPSTMLRIKELCEELNASNRTKAVSRAIEITSIVVKAIKAHKDVVIESKDGSRERLVIPELNTTKEKRQ
jgi:hypothetical protein